MASKHCRKFQSAE